MVLWTNGELKYLFSISYLFTDYLLEYPEVKWYPDVIKKFLPQRNVNGAKLKFSELKIVGKVNYDNIDREILEIVNYCQEKDTNNVTFKSLLNQTMNFKDRSTHDDIIELIVKQLNSVQIQCVLGNSEFYDQLWNQTCNSKTRMINCLILRIIHLVHFHERPNEIWESFGLDQLVCKGNLTAGDAFVRLPQLLMLPRFEYHEFTVDSIKEYIRSYPIDYNFIEKFERKCRELTIGSCIVNSKVEFFVRESMTTSVERVQIGEFPLPCIVYMLVQRVDNFGEMTGQWEKVKLISKEVECDELTRLSPANHLGDGTFHDSTKILSQERVFAYHSDNSVFINTPLKKNKVTQPVVNRVNNWSELEKKMKNTFLISSPCVKHVKYSQEFRLSSIKMKTRNELDKMDKMDELNELDELDEYLEKITNYLETREISNVTLNDLKGIFLLFGLLMGDGTAANCELALSADELELVKWVVKFMTPLASEGYNPYYNLIFSKKVIKNGFEEFDKVSIPFGGPKNIPFSQKKKRIDKLIKDGYHPSFYMVKYPFTGFNRLMKQLGFYEKDSNHATRVLKKIPQWMYDIPTVLASEYLAGMIYSDGHMSKHSRIMSFTQVDQHVMDHMIFMGVQCGYIVYSYPIQYDNDRIDLTSVFTGLSILGFDGHALKKKMYAHRDQPPFTWRRKLGNATKWKVKSMIEIKIDLKDSKSVLIPTSRGRF